MAVWRDAQALRTLDVLTEDPDWLPAPTWKLTAVYNASIQWLLLASVDIRAQGTRHIHDALTFIQAKHPYT